MKPDALLVIDVQNALVDDHPYHGTELLRMIQRLLSACRSHRIPVLYVQHTETGEGLLKGTKGWEIAEAIAPHDGETVIEKNFSSAFRKTDLNARLQSLGVKNLLMCGMQTEYCVDATCKVAFELGYHVIIPAGGTSTYRNGSFAAEDLIEYYENRIWNGRFADVLPAKEILKGIES